MGGRRGAGAHGANLAPARAPSKAGRRVRPAQSRRQRRGATRFQRGAARAFDSDGPQAHRGPKQFVTTPPPPNRPDATVIMSVQAVVAPVPLRPTEPRRLLYLVRAVDDQWEVFFGHTAERGLFATRAEALAAARAAARLHWSTQGQPSGVNVEVEGAFRLSALYGTETPA
jgi:hypothetical protein